jgi:hypothetical protein
MMTVGAALIEHSRSRARGGGARDRQDKVKAIRQRVKAWIADKFVDVIITGGTGTPVRRNARAVGRCSKRRWRVFDHVSAGDEKKIGTSAIQTRHGRVAKLRLPAWLAGPKGCRTEFVTSSITATACNFVEVLARRAFASTEGEENPTA